MSFSQNQFGNASIGSMFVQSANAIDYFSNVKSYGAVGDGVADDTAAFQSAVNHAGWLSIPDGNYSVGQIYATNNLVLIGGASSVLIQKQDGIPIIRFTSLATNVAIRGVQFKGLGSNGGNSLNSAVAINGKAADSLTISDCLFDGFAVGVYCFSNANNVVVSNCRFRHCSVAAIDLIASTRVLVSGCDIDGDRTGLGDGVPSTVGIWALDSGQFGGADWRVVGNFVANTKNEGINIHACYANISDNIVTNCTVSAYGIIVEGTTSSFLSSGFGVANQVNVHNNQVSYCVGGIGVQYDPGNIGATPMDVVVSDNIISHTTGVEVGIRVIGRYATNVLGRFKVSGNKLYDIGTDVNTSYGISIVDSSRGMVSDNLIEKTASYGIFLYGRQTNCCSDVSISGNSIIAPHTAGIFVDGAQTGAVQRVTVNNNAVRMDGLTGNAIRANNNNPSVLNQPVFENNVAYGTNLLAYRLTGDSMVELGNLQSGFTNRMQYDVPFTLGPTN